MSWFNASQLSSFAKQALSQAQKSIDRVLDIQEEEPGAWAETIPYGEPGKGEGRGASRGDRDPTRLGKPSLPRPPFPDAARVSNVDLGSPAPVPGAGLADLGLSFVALGPLTLTRLP